MATRTRLTAEDLWRMPGGDVRRELVDGNVVEMSPASVLHGRIAGRIYRRLAEHAERLGAGEALVGDVGFILDLPGDPERVRAPDVAFVARERLGTERPARGFFRGAPDLAVEVLSPSETATDVQQKVRDYLEAGARLVWIVAPETRSTTVYRANGSARLVRETEEIDGEDVLPGLRLHLSDVLI
jgi:Uma2 family endonuclease